MAINKSFKGAKICKPGGYYGDPNAMKMTEEEMLVVGLFATLHRFGICRMSFYKTRSFMSWGTKLSDRVEESHEEFIARFRAK